MNQLCRSCLIARESFQYVLFENVAADVYSFCTSVEISHDDGLPKTLCNTCHELLEKFSIFKRACIQAQNTLVLQNIMKKPKEESSINDSDVKSEIDESFEVVENEIKVNNEGDDESNDHHADFNNQFEGSNNEESNHVNENYNIIHTDITLKEDICDDEPIQELKKKIKGSVRKVKMKNSKVEENKIRKYVCKLCKSKFKYQERYEAHILEHQGQTVNKTCTVCKKVFMTWSGLRRHIVSEHEVMRMTTLCCKACGKVFNKQQTLKRHMKLHELPEKIMSVCDICGKSYGSPDTLKIHLETQHNENRVRDFSCEHCGKKFFTKHSLQLHIKRLHTGQRYICNICNYAFTVKTSLVKHMLQKHQGIKQHKCDICEKFFSAHSTLVIHKRIHSGERPYACDYCVKDFSSKYRLIEHHRTHTGERRHRCPVCNFAFTQLGSMKKHMQTQHSKAGPPPNILK